jgi:hypothetical protein
VLEASRKASKRASEISMMIGYYSMAILRIAIVVTIGINQDGCDLRAQPGNGVLYQGLSHERD